MSTWEANVFVHNFNTDFTECFLTLTYESWWKISQLGKGLHLWQLYDDGQSVAMRLTVRLTVVRNLKQGLLVCVNPVAVEHGPVESVAVGVKGIALYMHVDLIRRCKKTSDLAFHVDSPTPNWTRTIEQNNWAKNWLNKSQLIKKLTEHKSNDQTNNPTKINWSKSYWTMSQLIKFLAEQIAIEQLINWHLFSCQEGT